MDEEDHRAGGAGSQRPRQVAVQGEPVARREAHWLHLRQRGRFELGPVDEEELPLQRRAVEREVPRRALRIAEGHDPGPVGAVA
jgi:hypothetical protein